MTEKKISDKIIALLTDMVDRELYPATFDYLLLYGVDNAIPEMEYFLDGKTKEQIYQQCLDNGTTWQKVLKRIPKDAES